jgi:hypothetical protein
MTEIQITANLFEIFRHSDFEFVSDCRPHPRRLASLGFGFRASDF